MAEAAIAEAAASAPGARIDAGLVVAPHGTPAPALPPGVRFLTAAHPLPDAHSVAAAQAARALLAGAGAGDLVLALLSGGGSALLAEPVPPLTLDDLARTTRALQSAGADITLLNRVRRRIDLVKGGRLVTLAAPARVLCLAVSDVPGDDPAMIASGPFTPGADAPAGLVEEVERLGAALPPAVLTVLRPDAAHAPAGGDAGEPPSRALAGADPGEPQAAAVRYQVVASNPVALDAAAAAARSLGYDVASGSFPLEGEAADCGRAVAAAARGAAPGAALLFGGETTVRVRGRGRGGRNQELALAAAIDLAGTSNLVVGAAGTDGVDGSSPAAGGIVDGATAARIAAAGIDPQAALADNDSHTALAAAGAQLLTGATGTNVMDVVVVLRARADG
ncbi:MAG TPA: DUF4147 domain-containing protein, partial [Longimicrobiales bacterium]|nr:DUF4147 domain-containing protein [Longimicrobiales bacterium]